MSIMLKSHRDSRAKADDAGRRFVREDQMLGDIGFYVPYDHMESWAAHLSLTEILALYAPVEKREDRAAPTRKPQKKSGTNE